MSGTKAGSIKAQRTIKLKYGLDEEGKSALHVKSGRIGGQNSHNGGFASETIGKDGLTGTERASKAGYLGGIKSRRS